jgi:hypothetical protein
MLVHDCGSRLLNAVFRVLMLRVKMSMRMNCAIRMAMLVLVCDVFVLMNVSDSAGMCVLVSVMLCLCCHEQVFNVDGFEPGACL